MTVTNLTFASIKSRQRASWSTGNYAVVGTTLQIVGESLCEAIDLRAGSRVLDVAAGNGNATLAAAHRSCDVTSTDYVPSLLELGRRRAEAEGLTINFREADAEHLPFPDNSFDAVLSTFGVMFTPDQQRAADELARVCRPGGRIGLANWTPDSFIGEVFRILGGYVPRAPGLMSPALWGTRYRIEKMFGATARSVSCASRNFTFRYRTPMQWIDVFRTYYGPMKNAFENLDATGQAALTKDLLHVLNKGNRSGDGTLVLPSEYLEVVIDVR